MCRVSALACVHGEVNKSAAPDQEARRQIHCLTLQEQKISKTQLKAKIRAYKYRQKVLAPRRDTLTDLMKRIEGHIDGTVSTQDYVVRSPSTLRMQGI